MLKQGTQVTIYYDPFAQLHKEGTATIVEHAAHLMDDADQYLVHFAEDEEGCNVLRVVTDGPRCSCAEIAGDSPSCPIHKAFFVSVDGVQVPASVRMIVEDAEVE